jgi:hypothetical protein
MTKKLLLPLFFILLCGIFSFPVFAYTITTPVNYSEPIEVWDVGVLPHFTWLQNNGYSAFYTGDGDYNIIDTGCVSGRCINSNYFINANIPLTSRGKLYISIKLDEETTETYLNLWSNGGGQGLVYFAIDHNIIFNGENIGSWVAGTWYRVGFDFDIGKMRVNINGGAWSHYQNEPAMIGFNGLDFRKAIVIGEYGYLDSLTLSGSLDTESEPVIRYSDNLVVNGDFNGNAIGWTLVGDRWTYADGVMLFNDSMGAESDLYQHLSLKEGHTYLVTAEIGGTDGNVGMTLDECNFSGWYNAGDGVAQEELTYQSGCGDMGIKFLPVGTDLTVDNVSVQEITTPIFDNTIVASASNGAVLGASTSAINTMGTIAPVGFGVLIASTVLYKALGWFKALAVLKK